MKNATTSQTTAVSRIPAEHYASPTSTGFPTSGRGLCRRSTTSWLRRNWRSWSCAVLRNAKLTRIVCQRVSCWPKTIVFITPAKPMCRGRDVFIPREGIVMYGKLWSSVVVEPSADLL
jgi:hypothetical protein